MAGLYDASNMVDDIPRPAAPAPAPGAPAAPAPASPAPSAPSAFLGGQGAAAGDGAGNLKKPEVDVPLAVQELRKGDAARQLFTGASMHGELREDFERMVDPMLPEADRGARVAELSEMVADFNASHADVRMLLDHARTLARELPSPEQETEMQHQCREALRDRYGRDAEQVAEDARLLVARDPRLAEWLEETGLGNVPDVVLRFAELARSERGRGRLK